MIAKARIVTDPPGGRPPPEDLVDLLAWVLANVRAPRRERSDSYFSAVEVRGVLVDVHLEFRFPEHPRGR